MTYIDSTLIAIMRYIVVEFSIRHNKIFNLWNEMVNNKNSQI